jgi:hypothetical protein
MMRAWAQTWGWVAVAAMASALVACPLKKPGASDGGEDGSAEASAVAAAPEARPADAINASEMTRYPDEKPVDHAPLTAEAGGNMRTQAGPGGDLVMVLKRGTEVEKVAEHGNYYLVVADDAKDPSKKLMGWIAQAAFNGDGPHRAPAEVGDGGVHHVDAGTKPVVVDAGTKPGPLRVLDIHKSADGSCAAGYAPCSALCRATCKTVSDCGPLPLVTCTGGFCLGPGAQPCK